MTIWTIILGSVKGIVGRTQQGTAVPVIAVLFVAAIQEISTRSEPHGSDEEVVIDGLTPEDHVLSGGCSGIPVSTPEQIETDGSRGRQGWILHPTLAKLLGHVLGQHPVIRSSGLTPACVSQVVATPVKGPVVIESVPIAGLGEAALALYEEGLVGQCLAVCSFEFIIGVLKGGVAECQ